MKSIAVFCGSSLGHHKIIQDDAYRLGKVLASKKIDVVYGAAKIGLMGRVAQGAIDHSGKVIGIIPEFLKTKEIVHEAIDKLIVTHNMHDRKIKIYENSDGFIILPGGLGTMDEFFEISTWGQLGLHTKPIGILNILGYYTKLIEQFKIMVEYGFLKQDNLNAIITENTIEELLKKMTNFKPFPAPKWIDKDQL